MAPDRPSSATHGCPNPRARQRTFAASILTSNLLTGFLPACLLAQEEDPEDKVSLRGTGITPQASRTTLSQKDPTLDNDRLHCLPAGPDSFCPSTHLSPFPFHKPGSVSSTLETVLETLFSHLCSVSLPEITSSRVSPPLISLPLDFVCGKWPNLVCVGPPEKARTAVG